MIETRSPGDTTHKSGLQVGDEQDSVQMWKLGKSCRASYLEVKQGSIFRVWEVQMKSVDTASVGHRKK